VFNEGFLNYSACWRIKTALVSFQPFKIKTLVIYSVLLIILVASYCRVLLFNLLFIFCSTLMQCLFDEIILFDSILLFNFHAHPLNIQF
jgi:hypothetical protein